jgi:glycosyltransferase involved in cell wall biosynthesis
MSAPSISIVVPVYRSSASLPELVERLVRTLDSLDRTYELVLVDDCSPDESWAVLEQLREQYGKRLKIASLARNQGQHNAVLCGFSLATGDVVVTMDDDLQNPPEEIPRLIAAIDDGFDLAIGTYESKRHSRMRNQSGRVIDGLIRRIFRLPPDFSLTSFRAADGRLVRQAAEMTGVYPYVTCMLLAHSARPTNVVVRHDERKFGSSNYTLRRSFGLAANLLFSYSSAPVAAVALVSGLAVLGALTGASVVAIVALAGATVPGWASTLLAIAVSNAITLGCLTVLAIYVGRMNRQMSGPRVSFTIRSLHE